jgi:hypothetical protein
MIASLMVVCHELASTGMRICVAKVQKASRLLEKVIFDAVNG